MRGVIIGVGIMLLAACGSDGGAADPEPTTTATSPVTTLAATTTVALTTTTEPATTTTTTSTTTTTTPATTAAPATTIARDTALAVQQCIHSMGPTIGIDVLVLGHHELVDDANTLCDEAQAMLKLDGFETLELSTTLAERSYAVDLFYVHVLAGTATEDEAVQLGRDEFDWLDRVNALLDAAR